MTATAMPHDPQPTDPGYCASCGDPLAWTGAPGSRRVHAWSGRLGLPERPYGHAAQPPVDITDRQLLVDVHQWARANGWRCTWIGWGNAQISSSATTVVEWDHDELTVRRRPAAEVGQQWPSGLGSVGRRDRYPVTSVRQAVDFLVALDVLPARFSSAYRAAVAR